MANESYDQSHLDKKYFIDRYKYNCPFCKRGHVSYDLGYTYEFDWTPEKKCYIIIAKCESCGGKSMHLSYENLTVYSNGHTLFSANIEDIDSKLFYSAPTSFFVIDPRIHEIIRELITEAEGCLKMNYLTGASACMRKAIYELTVKEKCEGEKYEGKIKDLKTKHSQLDPTLIDVLAHIQDMTSDKIHEQSWDKWDSDSLKLIIETLKSVLYELYVEPLERKGRVSRVTQLLEKVSGAKKAKIPSKGEEA